MTVLNMLAQKRGPASFAPGLVMRLWRQDAKAFRRAWKDAGDDIDTELRVMNMRWEKAEIGIHFGPQGPVCYRTDRMLLISSLRYRLHHPRSPFEANCYRLRREAELRRMPDAMRVEAGKRWYQLDEVLRTEPKSVGARRRYGPLMTALLRLEPYGHEMPPFGNVA
jgi:hypothetical protein